MPPTSEPDRRYGKLTHEQLRSASVRMRWTDDVTDLLYQFCGHHGLSRKALPANADMSTALMRHIGFHTEDSEVFENALMKALMWIENHMTPLELKGLLEETKVVKPASASATQGDGKGWLVRHHHDMLGWLENSIQVSKTGIPRVSLNAEAAPQWREVWHPVRDKSHVVKEAMLLHVKQTRSSVLRNASPVVVDLTSQAREDHAGKTHQAESQSAESHHPKRYAQSEPTAATSPGHRQNEAIDLTTPAPLDSPHTGQPGCHHCCLCNHHHHHHHVPDPSAPNLGSQCAPNLSSQPAPTLSCQTNDSNRGPTLTPSILHTLIAQYLLDKHIDWDGMAVLEHLNTSDGAVSVVERLMIADGYESQPQGQAVLGETLMINAGFLQRSEEIINMERQRHYEETRAFDRAFGGEWERHRAEIIEYRKTIEAERERHGTEMTECRKTIELERERHCQELDNLRAQHRAELDEAELQRERLRVQLEECQAKSTQTADLTTEDRKTDLDVNDRSVHDAEAEAPQTQQMQAQIWALTSELEACRAEVQRQMERSEAQEIEKNTLASERVSSKKKVEGLLEAFRKQRGVLLRLMADRKEAEGKENQTSDT